MSGIDAASPVSFEAEILDPAGARVANPKFPASATGANTSYTVTPALVPNTRFSWRARAITGTETGAWSEFHAFTSAREDVPTLNLPAPTLGGAQWTWSRPLDFFIYNMTGPNVPANLLYEIEIRNSNGELLGSVSGPPVNDGSQGTKLATNMPLPGGVPLTWRARARAGTLAGPWSVTQTFAIQQLLHVTGFSFNMDVGTSTQLIATFKQRGTTENCAGWATWTVDNPSVARVAPGGLLTAVGLGSTNVTAKCDGVSETNTTDSVELWNGTFRVDSCAPGPCSFGSTVGATRQYGVVIRSRPGGDRIVTSAGEGTLSADGVLVIDQVFDSDAGCDTSWTGSRSTMHVNGSQIPIGSQALNCNNGLQPVGAVQTTYGTADRLHRGK